MTVWPKEPPVLSDDLLQKKAAWELYWLTEYPSKFSFVREFTVAFVRSGAPLANQTILEIGPGLQPVLGDVCELSGNYFAVERSGVMAASLRGRFPRSHIVQGDIADGTNLPSAHFDRVIAAHVFEHIPDLPRALREIRRLLKPTGFLDVVLPCEGGLGYRLGRRFSSAKVFRAKFGSGFEEIIKSEHINTIFEIVDLLKTRFSVVETRLYPFNLWAAALAYHFNLLYAARLRSVTGFEETV
jgi:SAM-dependent methyltransferase